VILIDSNVPMYLVGAAHPNKTSARLLLERVVVSEKRLVTDAEVLQEILHRYTAIGRPEAIQPALDVLLGVVDEVLPVERDDVLKARDVLLAAKRISARDALHVAIMRRHGIESILSFDRGFDKIPGLRRVSQ
jgi:predicted nucleic acid-binding protein